jgi:hypothetical protein
VVGGGGVTVNRLHKAWPYTVDMVFPWPRPLSKERSRRRKKSVKQIRKSAKNGLVLLRKM